MGDTPLKPDQIRVIREGLGLSQREAGKLLGGGPNAFAKYESGTLAPAAALANLLLVLRDNPAALSTLRPDHAPVPVRQPLPFQVTSQRVGRVGKQMFPQFLRLLLQAEALSHGIPSHDIHVADNVDAPDGGEDGRIQWQGGPEQTRFLPSRFTQFQLKTGDISPAAAGKEVLSKAGEVKPMVGSAFAEGATYMVLSTRTYTREQLEKREGRIRAALKGAGLDIDNHRVHFRDASQLADWANAHPAVATWFLEKVERGFPKEFRSWSHWAGRPEHASLWVKDERLSHLRQFLHQQAIAEPGKTARVVGLWGIGKSRLALEAFRPTGADDLAPSNLSSLVLYAVESEAGFTALQNAVQRLADSGARAVVIVDECAPKTHRALVGMVERETSQLSLVTLDDEIPSETLNASTHKIEEAPDAVTEAIVNRVASGLQGEDQRRLARFSRGFPRMSILIAQAWRESTPLAHATEQDLVKSYILGRDPDEADLVLKSARLLATFGLVDYEDNTKVDRIASLGRLSDQDLRAGVGRLTERGIARRRGRYVLIEPRPIGMRLAEQQWQEWSEDTWDKILADSFPSTIKLLGFPIQIDELGLHVQAAKQLKLLNHKELKIAQNVVKHVCQYEGIFDNLQGNLTAGHAEVLSYLAEIDSSAVAEQIRRLLNDIEDLSIIAGNSRSHLVRALERISFPRDTFEDGARLLLRLAAAENQQWANNATGQFIALFPIRAGGTEANGTERLDLLDDLLDDLIFKTDNIAEQEVLIKSLAEVLELNNCMRVLGAEAHGTRPALRSWQPKTKDEADNYINGCASRLAHFAVQDDANGVLARDALGTKLRSLLQYGFIDMIESIVRKVGAAVVDWPQALESLDCYLRYDSADATDEVLIKRVQKLRHQIEPKTLEARLRFLVNEMPWNYLATRENDSEKTIQRQVYAVRKVAAEALQQPEILRNLLPRLSRGQQRMTHVFGQALGERTDSWDEWLQVLTQAVEGTPEAERCYGLLVGYLTGLATHQPDVVEAFKQRAVQSPTFAPTLSRICIWSSIGCTPSDLMLMTSALQKGTLSPHQLHPGSILYSVDDASRQAAVLVNVLIDHSDEGLANALNLLGPLDGERLGAFRCQIRKIAENTLRLPPMRIWHFFEKLMTWMLQQESGDHDVVATAIALAKAVANLPDVNYDYEKKKALQSVLPILLSKFSGIAWQLIGSAIISTERTYVFESLMSGGIQFGHQRVNSPLLSLPEDALFAWCHAHPEKAPAFVARTVLFLTSDDSNSDPVVSVHPVMVRLLEDFGDRENVTSALIRNISSGGWSGSIEAFHQKKYEKKREPIKLLLEHPHKNVRRWAKDALDKIQTMLEQARNWDAHSQARFWE